MARMNWNRVGQSNRQRAGMSDMELADERDERWFAREAQRLAQREARQAALTDKGDWNKPTEAERRGSEKKRKREQPSQRSAALDRQAIARQLGVTTKEVKQSGKALGRASSGLGGVPKRDRKATAAKRLGITADELRLLGRALAGNVDALRSSTRLASLVRTTATLDVAPVEPVEPKRTVPARRSTPTPGPPARREPTKKPTSAAKSTRRRKSRNEAPARSKDQLVYVTMWGNVVHLFHDCHSTRGFRGTGEPDPDLYRVKVQDPSCRGRRVCGTCKNVSGVVAKKVDQLLHHLHGKPFDESEWQRHGWFRPKPSGAPVSRGR